MEARTLSAANFNTDKSPEYLSNYMQHFGHLKDESVAMLELGVNKGGSLLMWADYFQKGQIVGLDINPVHLPQAHDRITIYQGSQDDVKLLERIRNEKAPGGFDIIIDDASHIGSLTEASFNALFDKHLKPGGIYVIEDWGTGYWPDFPDGALFREFPLLKTLAKVEWLPKVVRQICENSTQHSAGMVGFIKRLVDEAGRPDIRSSEFNKSNIRESRFQSLQVCVGQVFIHKKYKN